MSDSEQPPETAGHGHHDYGCTHDVDGPRCATPQSAVEQADRETTAYVMDLYVGTDVDAPDFLAVVDVDPGLRDLRRGRRPPGNAEPGRRTPPRRVERLLVVLPRRRAGAPAPRRPGPAL